MHIDIRIASALVGALLAAQAQAAEHVIHQKGPASSAAKLLVRQGESLKFVNDDPFAHNVFSLSDTRNFDLGSHGQGTSRSVVMDKAGTVEVECAVHPDMKMTVDLRT